MSRIFEGSWQRFDSFVVLAGQTIRSALMLELLSGVDLIPFVPI